MGMVLARGEMLKVLQAKRVAQIRKYLAVADSYRPAYFRTHHVDLFALDENLDEDDEEEEEGGEGEEGGEEEEEEEEDEEGGLPPNTSKEEMLPMLFAAVHRGRVDGVMALINKRAKVGWQDEFGRTPLLVAAQRGHDKLVLALIQRDAELEDENDIGWTPLLMTCFHGQTRAMKCIMRRQCNVRHQDVEGMTALHLIAVSPLLNNVLLVPIEHKRVHAQSRKDRFLNHITMITKERKAKERAAQQRAARQALHGDDSEEDEEMVPVPDLPPIPPMPGQVQGVPGQLGPDGRPIQYGPDGKPMQAVQRIVLGPEGEAFIKLWKSNPNVFECVIYDELFKGAQKRSERLQVNARDKHMRTPLNYAAREGKVLLVSRLLHDQADINLPDDKGVAPLVQAIQTTKLEMVEALLDCKARINQADNMFRTPLHFALEKSNEVIVHKLLRAKADVNAYDATGRTPLHCAMAAGSTHLLLMLLECGPSLDAIADPGWNILIFAVRHLLLKPLAEVLNKEGDAMTTASQFKDRQGMTALHHAVEMQHTESVDILLKLRADPIARDCNGNTPLHVACERGNLDILQRIADQVETVDPRNHNGESPLHVAASRGNLAAVAYLAQENKQLVPADFGARDDLQRTVLMHACASGSLDLLNVLILNRSGDNRAFSFCYMQLNDYDVFGNSALSIAAREGHWVILPSLILAKASITCRDVDGWGPLHMCAAEGEAECARVLLECGAEVNVEDARGWTPLMHGVSYNHHDVCRILLEYFADPLHKNHDHRTALALAIDEDRIGKGLNLVQKKPLMNADQRRMMKKKDLEREEAERAKNRQFTLPFNESEQLVRKQIQELLTDYIGKEKEVKKRNSVESCAKELNGHFMLTILRCENLWIHGKLEDAMSTYCWVTYRDKKESNVQGYASSLCLQTRNPVWVDNLRLEFDSLDGHAFLAIFVMSVPGDPHLANLSHLDAAQDAQKAKKAHLHGAVKKTPLEMKLEAMKKAAIKKQKEEMLKLAAQQAADADTGARELSPTEKQWLVLKNYLQLLEQQSNIQLPMPAVPDQHCPVGVLLVNARTMRHAIRTKEPLQIERSLLCGHGRMSVGALLQR
jgi:ankyrin repeat protein